MSSDKEDERLHCSQQSASPSASTDGDDSMNSYSRPVKKRKATYLVKKEEKARLNQEMQELEAQLATLKERVGLTGVQSIEKVATSNMVLGNFLRQQQLLVTNAYAGLASCVVSSFLCLLVCGDRHSDYWTVLQRGLAPNPLYSYIHLGVDPDRRRQVLNAIRDSKLQNGVDYVQTRSQHLDLLQPYATSEQYVDAQGNFCSSCFDVVQFTGVKSVREVFDAAMFHFMNEEISISERLGVITLRDDFSIDEDDFSNCRLFSADEDGVKTEVNTASFAQYVDAAQSDSGESFAVLVRDSVDVDDLYPYSPDECVRKDQMGSILVTAIRKSAGSEGNQDEKGELVVIMRRAGFVKIHRPAFPVPECTQRGLLNGITSWFEVTLAAMQAALSTRTTS